MIISGKIDSAELVVINQRLIDYYGKGEKDLPFFRVVWSEDEFEKRWTDCTPEGLQLLRPEVKELPKYRQWIHAKYILEGLTIKLDNTQSDNPEMLTYEPLFVFEQGEKALYPRWEVCKIVLDSVRRNLEQAGNYTREKDPRTDVDYLLSEKARIEGIQEEIFGNETDTMDAVRFKEGIVVPNSYQSTKES